ncbi:MULTISPECIES: hypothetical protein [Photorhabdus]|nr:hypothetical protein [Photorhabdus asymbiotica]
MTGVSKSSQQSSNLKDEGYNIERRYGLTIPPFVLVPNQHRDQANNN